MAADILTSLATWSTSEGSNLPSGTTAVGTNLDDNFRMIQSVVRYTMASDTIASATTTDLGTKESQFLTVSGTTTITGFGSISAGITKYVTFSGALTLTHNATSLILPGAASITTAAGDTGRFLSLGSGNWKCLSYTKASGLAVVSSPTLLDGTAAAPSLNFASDTNTGLYRIGADSLGFSANGVKVAEMSAANGLLSAGAIALGLLPNLNVDTSGQVSLLSNISQSITIGSSSGGVPGQLGRVTIRGGNQTAGGGSSNFGGDVEIQGGHYTFAGGTTGYRGGNVTIQSGNCSDPSSIGTTGTITLNIGTATSGATPGNIILKGSVNTYLKVNDNYKSISTGGATPTITSGAGTGATIAGNANNFKVTLGTTPTSTVVITFATPVTGSVNFLNAPTVFTNYETASIHTYASATTTTVTINFASTPVVGGVLHVMCMGYE